MTIIDKNVFIYKLKYWLEHKTVCLSVLQNVQLIKLYLTNEYKNIYNNFLNNI